MAHTPALRSIRCVACRIVPILTLLAPAMGQPLVVEIPGLPADSVGSEDGSGGTRFPIANRRTIRLYRTAVEHLEAKRFDEAIVYFQTILDADVDGFVEPEGSRGGLVSLRNEAARHLGSLIDDARQAYELRYGAVAKGLFNEAILEADGEKLVTVARRFPATEAGREAAFRLALVHLDRGQPLAAAAQLERIRERATPVRRPAILLRLAVCYARIGDESRKDAILKELAEFGGDTVRVGDEAVELSGSAAADVLRELGDHDPGVATSNWPVAGGGATRTGYRRATTGRASEWSADGLPDPFAAPDAAPSVVAKRLARWAAQTALVELAAGRPATPAVRPISAGETVFVRTPSNVVAIDGDTGRPLWRTLADPLSWDYLTESIIDTPSGEAAGRTLVGQRLWSDATWGTLSTDGRFVIAVEETGTATPLPPPPGSDGIGNGMPPVLPIAFNRLVAYDVVTGRRTWEAGGAPDESLPLGGAFFLGSPVPIGGQWFVLCESAGATQLVAFDPARREGVVWTQSVAEHDSTIERDLARRTAGLSPTVVGGLLVCPVGDGCVVAVDPSTRSLMWVFSPDRGEQTGLPPAVSPPSTEVVAASHFVLIGSTGGSLSAVDPMDGSVVWSERRSDLLWIIGADEASVYVQTPTGVVACRLADGMPAWRLPAAIGPPSGRGVIVGSRLYLPLAEASLAVLDAATGRLVGSIPTAHGEPLGNLIVAGDTIISQSATRVIALPVPK